MRINEITDKSQWDDFVLSRKPETFLQSWNWSQFNLAMGDKVWRLGLFDGDDLAGAALIVGVKAKRGKFLFCPHGPVLKNPEMPVFLFDYLKKLAKQEKADFVRISPLLDDTEGNKKLFQSYGFRDAPIHMMHPELSWLLDISKDEDDILRGMRKTTRNLIRRAEREGVQIEMSRNAEDVGKFYRLHSQTVSRHSFTPFSEKYLEKEFEAFVPDDRISLFFARHGGQALSAAIIVFYGRAAFYHHGASSASKVPSSYLLLWEAFREAKRRGCEVFNFWGIAPENKPRHPWSGLTFFKTGFGGYRRQYLHCQDLPLTGRYRLNWLVESLRKWKKGY